MKKVYSIILLIAIAFTLNGCLVDRIKQRIEMRRLQEQYKKAEELKRLEQQREVKQKIYQPSPSPLQETVVHKKIVKKSIKKSRNKKTVAKKRTVIKRVKKHEIELEPYSIKDKENDPELLGPQTTLESNPLAREAGQKGTKG